MTSFRAAVVQFEPAPDDPATNLATVERLARGAVRGGARLVVFPELCLLGYWHLRRHSQARLRELAQPADGPLVSRVLALAKELDAGLGVGFLEEAEGTLFNAYAVCLPDGQVHVHRKLHAFEHEEIAAGSAYTVFDTPWGFRAGVLICWDNNLVENVRITALLGATVLLAPHQTGGTNSRSPHGMKPIPLSVWRTGSTILPRSRKRSTGRAGVVGCCAGCRRGPMTTGCSCCSATVWGATTTNCAPATR
ncbi:nitrilase-related carbon-nitrogen hydrolase [Kribbella sp. NPDC048915]|uniref:nitrilase-related carbon-nitrogen hydrolase n=1 Tax=Kribbella sp. NPDC048915 TaxID=3155148 RepID=UPI003402EC80